MQRKRVYISGRVQGVYFRAYTRDAAKKCGVRGWVKNLSDGRVEAVFEGEYGAVEKILSWCREGSPHSSVSCIEIIDEPYLGEFKDFVIDG